MQPKARKLMVKIVGIIGIIAIMLGVLLPGLSAVFFSNTNSATTNTAEATT